MGDIWSEVHVSERPKEPQKGVQLVELDASTFMAAPSVTPEAAAYVEPFFVQGAGGAEKLRCGHDGYDILAFASALVGVLKKQCRCESRTVAWSSGMG